MEQKEKLRICELLGVELGEAFYIEELGNVKFRILADGTFEAAPANAPGTTAALLRALNGQYHITRRPRWTKREMKDAANIVRVFGRKDSLKRTLDGALCFGDVVISGRMLPSLSPGQTVELQEILGNESV